MPTRIAVSFYQGSRGIFRILCLRKRGRCIAVGYSLWHSFCFWLPWGGDQPFALAKGQGVPFIFIFQALPMIVVMGAISMLLFHWGVLPWVVRGLARGAQKGWNIGGALATAMAAKLFLGQTDGPLLVKPYLARFSSNELFSVMTAGMATTSVVLFALYNALLGKVMGNEAAWTHLVTSAVINIPASLMMAEIMVPHRGDLTQGEAKSPYNFVNSMEAIAQGTLDGWTMMGAIGALLISALAFVYIGDRLVGGVTLWILGQSISLDALVGTLCAPFAWCLGIPWTEALQCGAFLAKKWVLNEVVALMDVSHSAGSISGRSLAILTYSICGFGNLSSIAIQIGGFSSLIPTRKEDIVTLAPWALLAGSLAGGISSALVSLMI